MVFMMGYNRLLHVMGYEYKVMGYKYSALWRVAPRKAVTNKEPTKVFAVRFLRLSAPPRDTRSLAARVVRPRAGNRPRRRLCQEPRQWAEASTRTSPRSAEEGAAARRRARALRPSASPPDGASPSARS